jgi:hypothetical protein
MPSSKNKNFLLFQANSIAQLSPSGGEKELDKIINILECYLL